MDYASGNSRENDGDFVDENSREDYNGSVILGASCIPLYFQSCVPGISDADVYVNEGGFAMAEYSTAVENVMDENRDLLEKWLTFCLDGQLYGSSIVHVEQIVSMMPITEVPEYPPYAKGVINIRGAIVPLIDLRLRIGKAEAEYTDQTCIIICRINENQIGFIADSVDAVMTIQPDMI